MNAVDEPALLRLAEGHLRNGDAGRARALLERGVGRLPASVALRLRLAELDRRSGRTEEAIASVEGALALEPEDQRAWKLLDAWSAETGEASGAVTRIEALCRERPWSGRAALNLAWAKARRDDLAGALNEAARRAGA